VRRLCGVRAWLPHTPNALDRLRMTMDHGKNHLCAAMEDADQGAIEAKPDGQFLHDWYEAHGIGRSVAFAMVKIVQSRGKEPERQRQSGATKPSVFLSGQFLAAMDALAMEHKSGMSVSQLQAKYATAIATTAPTAAVQQLHEDEPLFEPSQLMKRLEAAKLAIDTGLPLRKAEIEWIMGGTVQSVHVRGSLLKASRHGMFSWTLMGPEI
jgi:hypothetical protein